MPQTFAIEGELLGFSPLQSGGFMLRIQSEPTGHQPPDETEKEAKVRVPKNLELPMIGIGQSVKVHGVMTFAEYQGKKVDRFTKKEDKFTREKFYLTAQTVEAIPVKGSK